MHPTAARLPRMPAAPPLRGAAGRSRLPRPNVRVFGAAVVLAALLAAGWLALRDSRLVAVRDVEVAGASGPQRAAIREALTLAGEDMTTLHVRPDVLRSAVAPYPVVKDVRVEADIPHGLRVTVVQHVPVAVVVTPQGSVPVAADGTVLRGSTAAAVPELTAQMPPAGDRITDRRTLETVELVAGAPAALRPRLASAFRGPRGLTVHLADGPAVHFGNPDRLAAKWASLTAVLASPASRGASAIDVRVPERPAAAGLVQESVQEGQASTGG